MAQNASPAHDHEHRGQHLAQHLFFHKLPVKANSRQALFDFVAKLHESLLDRSRPLWELHVIDGVVGNRVALTCIDGALRNYLADLGVELHRPITIQMPANLRREGEKTAGKAR